RLADLDRAAARYDALIATTTRPVLLHGDLHLGNVLDGGADRGLVAIDPKACVGDPCFDAVDYVLDGAGLDGVSFRCARLAQASGWDPDRLDGWCRAIAPIVAISHLGRGSPPRVVAELLSLAS
ncbi:MAG: aminoglycoside phosphotransferase family protein, partial [Acidimicrobiales bacterium]